MPQTAKLVTTSNSQVVQLPVEFRFPGNEVTIRKDPHTGDVILSPSQQQAQQDANWEELFRLLNELTPEERESFTIPRDTAPPALP